LKKPSKKSEEKPVKIQKKSYPKISYAILGIASIVLLMTLVPVVFPALYSMSTVPNGFEKMGLQIDLVDKYELGVLAIPLIFSNVIVFGLYIFRKKISIISKISKIFSIDIPQKVSLVVVVVVIVAYGSITFPEVYINEQYQDWQDVLDRLDNNLTIQQLDPVLRIFLLNQSMILFGSYKIIPLLFSMALLAMTYLFTTSITKNRFAGLVSMGLVLQSYIFLTFDTSSTYTSFWLFFYLLSLYAVVKLWFTNPVFYVASIFCKAITAVFSPMSIFFILNSNIPKKQRMILAGIILVMIIAGALGILGTGKMSEEFKWHEFVVGFASFAFQMRFDVITVLFLVPLIFGLFVISKNNRHANSISFLIIGILFSAPLLSGLTDQTNQPYRQLPLVVFFAVGVGMLFSKVNSKV
jgi:hypothetical protein